MTLVDDPSSEWTTDKIMTEFHDHFHQIHISEQHDRMAAEFARASSWSIAAVQKMFSIVFTNGLSIQPICESTCGGGFFHQMSYVNHSCEFNAIIMPASLQTGGSRLSYVASRDIRQWEEITTTYLQEIRTLDEDTRVWAMRQLCELPVDNRRYALSR
jgi:hypothetical protein